jgi:transcriptional regulator GlxA family with amidase domain
MILNKYGVTVSAHPEMANLPDLGVARKILSSDYQPYAPQGHSIDNLEEILEHQGDTIPWLHKQHDRGEQIAAMCTGTFFLAETGLLDHKSDCLRIRPIGDFLRVHQELVV